MNLGGRSVVTDRDCPVATGGRRRERDPSCPPNLKVYRLPCHMTTVLRSQVDHFVALKGSDVRPASLGVRPASSKALPKYSKLLTTL